MQKKVVFWGVLLGALTGVPVMLLAYLYQFQIKTQRIIQ
jgi:hypothetical protein